MKCRLNKSYILIVKALTIYQNLGRELAMFGEHEILAVAEDKNNEDSLVIQDGKCPVMSFNCYGLETKEAVQHAYLKNRTGTADTKGKFSRKPSIR